MNERVEGARAGDSRGDADRRGAKRRPRQDAPLVLATSLSYLPPELPVRGVAIELKKDERAASAFVPVRGRWIWVWDLERLASIVSHASS